METITVNGIEYERYKRPTGGRGSANPRVTIGKRGYAKLNQVAYEVLGEPERVELWFDKGKQVIGIKKASPTDPHSRAVSDIKNQQFKLISFEGFASHYEIDISTTRRYVGKMKGDMLVIDLEKPDE